MKEIHLTQGKVALVDDEDFDALNQHKWCILRNSRTFYAKRTKRGLLMHREIMKPPEGMVVDHINFNGLDNRRSNLRVCTVSENSVHTLACKNVKQHPNGRWRAQCDWLGKRHHLGYFSTEAEGLSAVRAFRLSKYPEFVAEATE